jgi:hypothetical protein
MVGRGRLGIGFFISRRRTKQMRSVKRKPTSTCKSKAATDVPLGHHAGRQTPLAHIQLTPAEAAMLARGRHEPFTPTAEAEQLLALSLVDRGLMNLRDSVVWTSFPGGYALAGYSCAMPSVLPAASAQRAEVPRG